MARSRSQVKREAVQEEAAKATAGPDADDPPDEDPRDHDGVVLTANWGDEKFTPVKNSYSTFTVGGFEMSVKIPPNVDLQMAARKVMSLLDEVAEEQFELKLEGFMRRLRKAQREGSR